MLSIRCIFSCQKELFSVPNCFVHYSISLTNLIQSFCNSIDTGSKETKSKGNSQSWISICIKIKYEFLNYTFKNYLASDLQVSVTSQ
jgi:hypothetical protein